VHTSTCSFKIFVWASFKVNKLRELWRSNQKGTIQRNWQHRVHKRKKNKTNATQYVLDTTIEYPKKHNTIYVGHHYTQTNTNNVNKTWALLQTTGGTEELNIVFIRISNKYFFCVVWPPLLLKIIFTIYQSKIVFLVLYPWQL
jgi:hypothetical protein